MNFRVGQKVVCVGEVKPEARARWPDAIWPEKNGIYTIRTINEWSTCTLVTLVEIDNNHLAGVCSRLEPGFEQKHFRPLIERKTDISIFTALLHTKERSRELCGND